MNEGSALTAPANGATLAPPNASAAIPMTREAMEVITQMQIAKAYPRDVQRSLDRILMACTRPKLAEAAIYTYTKGGQDVTGPSIRLAEAIAQNWGNMAAGVREIEQRNNGSVCESFAVDYETNNRVTKTFFVSHIRHTKKGDYLVTDPREVYEMVANYGARRVRACILAIVPGDIVEEALTQCEKTIKGGSDTIDKETIKKLVVAFAKMGVGIGQLTKYLQRNVEAMTPAQLVKLRGIYQSIRDGMSKPDQWFEADTADAPADAEKPKKESAEETFKKATENARKAMGKGKTPAKSKTPKNTEDSPSSGDSAPEPVQPEEAETPDAPDTDLVGEAESVFGGFDDADGEDAPTDPDDPANQDLPW